MDRGFSYSARSTNVGRRRLWIATIFVVALFIIDIVTGGAVRSLVRDAAASFSLDLHDVGEHIAAGGYFVSHASLATENQSLKAEVAGLQEQAALSSSLEAQVTTLSAITHLAATAPGITAPIASSLIASPYGTFLIGAGSAEGVEKGALVVSDENVVLGTISDVSTHSATVVEIFAPGRVVDALIDGASITVQGLGGTNAQAQVPNGVTVNPGDAVTAPEFAGRTIGVVGHVDANPSNAAMQIAIGSPVNLASIDYVYVIPAGE